MIDGITGGIASAKATYELAKNVKAIIDKIGDAEAKMQMADLMSALADVKMDAAEKAGRIAKLEQQLSLKEQMAYEAPYYWKVRDSESRDGPYCQKCYDEDSKAIRLQQKWSKKGLWTCQVCRSNVYDENYKSEPLPLNY